MHGIEHSYSPVRTPEMNGQSGAITPKTGGALTPEIDSKRALIVALSIKSLLERNAALDFFEIAQN